MLNTKLFSPFREDSKEFNLIIVTAGKRLENLGLLHDIHKNPHLKVIFRSKDVV